MYKKALISVATLLIALLLPFSIRAAAKPVDGDEGATFESVIKVVRDSLTEAQANDVADFPKLTDVTISLNTTVSKKGGISLKFLIFTIGGTIQSDSSSSIELQMKPPPSLTTVSSVSPDDLKLALAQAINSAKIAILHANDGVAKGAPGYLMTSKVTIEIKFAISHAVSGGIDTATILPIGVGGTGNLSKSQIHSLKLTFGS